jgi:hypothetical protein
LGAYQVVGGFTMMAPARRQAVPIGEHPIPEPATKREIDF